MFRINLFISLFSFAASRLLSLSTLLLLLLLLLIMAMFMLLLVLILLLGVLIVLLLIVLPFYSLLPSSESYYSNESYTEFPYLSFLSRCFLNIAWNLFFTAFSVLPLSLLAITDHFFPSSYASFNNSKSSSCDQLPLHGCIYNNKQNKIRRTKSFKRTKEKRE